jgi:replicative DNA helicase
MTPVETASEMIACCLADHRYIDECASICPGHAMPTTELRIIWSTMIEMAANGEHVDWVTLPERIKLNDQVDDIGGIGYLTRIGTAAQSMPTSALAQTYARRVIDHHIRTVAVNLVRLHVAKDETATGGADWLAAMIADLERVSTGASTVQTEKICDGMQKEVDAIIGHEPTAAVPTGIAPLDELTGGLDPELTIVFGHPGSGKSALCLNICTYMAIRKRPVLYISLEDSNRVMRQRVLSMLSKVDLQVIRSHRGYPDVYEPLQAVPRRFGEIPFFVVHDPGAGLDSICAEIRSARRRRGAELVVVDYLSCIRVGQRMDVLQHVEHCSKALANASQSADMPVLLVHHATKPRKDIPASAWQKLRQGDMSYGGDRAARMVLGVEYPHKWTHESDYGEHDMIIRILKNNNGVSGKVVVDCNLACMRVGRM